MRNQGSAVGLDRGEVYGEGRSLLCVRPATVLRLRLLPVHLDSVDAAVEARLQGMLLKYMDQLEGVLVEYRNVQLVQDTARIVQDSPYLYVQVVLDAVVFCPLVDAKTVGRVNHTSVDHVAFLVHGLFNGNVRADPFLREHGYEYCAEENRWTRMEDPSRQGDNLPKYIAVETELPIVIRKVKRSGALLSLRARLDDSAEVSFFSPSQPQSALLRPSEKWV